MYIVRILFNNLLTISAIVLLNSFTANAAETQYFKPGEIQFFKELPEITKIKPPLRLVDLIYPVLRFVKYLT